ncbi:hypothetical protein M0722_04645 [Microbacterium sp. KSW4-16]|uniref:hypothetical protein n=1 Tax=Microbacterium TaxID=33882 RepID=UPI00103F7C67|nr:MULTISPECIES: hypothetical protein [Microbacterium]MCK8466470.1 hypothetical protein [Microbacterium aurugineum]QEA29092.1 glycosyltransferase family 4 protein [Microbacterium sp. CBA3102]TCJ27983.1 hypothetical protein E0W80_07685 [Microbacterium sp. PI-1]
MSNERPRILCISLSPLRSDARVLRQISLLSEIGDVTTVGFGAAPDGVFAHHQVPEGLSTLPQTPLGIVRLALRMHRSAEISAPAVRWTANRVGGHTFDLVVANEARALGVAHRIADGAPVWADMHEWAPEERTHILRWRLLVAPFMVHLCRTYLPPSALVTTVGDGIAALYRQQFDVPALVMRNAGGFRALKPSPVSDEQIRLVHSGAAIHGRRLELMIETMKLLDARFTLDLYLMPGGDGGAYLRELRASAAPDSRITFHPPVPPEDLPRVLNAYDVGVFWIPPTHTNARLTLPNKFFDFVQARLMVAVGPSPEMAELVTRHDLGVISHDFTPESCAQSLTSLDMESVRSAKAASDAAAQELSFENDAAHIRAVIESILGARSGGEIPPQEEKA